MAIYCGKRNKVIFLLLMKIHFLDVGLEKYGDCILIENRGRFLLIDGAHHADGVNRGSGRLSIPEQLEKLMGPAPFRPDLLMVTHVHGDHVGCLPGLVAAGTLDPQRVLAADPWLGSGRTINSDAPQDRIVEALLEESPIESLEDAERLLDWSPEQSYNTMLRSLDPEIVWVFGEHSTEDLEAEFADFELKILGPTLEHLEICADLIASEKEKAARRLNDLAWPLGDAAFVRSDAELLLKLASSPDSDSGGLADMKGQGSAKNDQSIVLTVGNAHHRVLLAGDMQFELPEVPGLETLMEELLASVVAAGPYTVVKTCHHTSHNGMDVDVLDLLGGSPILVHTGGLNDPGHPARKVLENLAERSGGGDFYRTDRNGAISIDLIKKEPVISIGFGSANDLTPNPSPPRRPRGGRDELRQALVTPASKFNPKPSEDFVEVITRVPHVATTVTVTIQVQPPLSTPPPAKAKEAGEIVAQNPGNFHREADDLKIAGTRALPKLLVVTSTRELGKQIGSDVCAKVLRSLKSAGLEVLDLVAGYPDPEPSIRLVHAKLRGAAYEGVVILGGYSVVPSVRMSAIDDELRANATSEMDNYIVWSDDPYVTMDDDGIPDFPISRIPSLPGMGWLVEKCLQSVGPKGTRAFGIRNQARPFADEVFKLISAGPCHPSMPTVPSAYLPADVEADHLYFMLHGHYAQGEAFTGEDGNGGYPVAISTSEIPENFTGVVFAGCCYGALLTDMPAMYARPAKFPRERDLDESMALTLLAAGAQAFVGCTGIHYSPQSPNSMGEPMHRLFWNNLRGGQAPAPALFNAKLEYLKGVPHTGTEDATDIALELKIFSQFTCLGIGW